MIDFLDEIDDEQTDDLLQPEGEGLPDGLYEHFRFVADKGQSLIRVDKFLLPATVSNWRRKQVVCWPTISRSKATTGSSPWT